MKLLQCSLYYYALNAFKKVIVSHCSRLTTNCIGESLHIKKTTTTKTNQLLSSISVSLRAWFCLKCFFHQFVAIFSFFFTWTSLRYTYIVHANWGTCLCYACAMCQMSRCLAYLIPVFFSCSTYFKYKCLWNGHKQFAQYIIVLWCN